MLQIKTEGKHPPSAEWWPAHLPTLSLCGWPLIKLLVSALCWKQTCVLMSLWIFMNVDGDSRGNFVIGGKVKHNFLWICAKVWAVIHVLEWKPVFIHFDTQPGGHPDRESLWSDSVRSSVWCWEFQRSGILSWCWLPVSGECHEWEALRVVYGEERDHQTCGLDPTGHSMAAVTALLCTCAAQNIPLITDYWKQSPPFSETLLPHSVITSLLLFLWKEFVLWISFHQIQVYL